MSFSKKGTQTIDNKRSSPGKVASLNPNAAEFVPFALRSPTGPTSASDVKARFDSTGTNGKAVLERSQSSVSINSDEEARQYWSSQLPDDITPDFNVLEEDESQGLENSLSLAGLSLHDSNEASRYNSLGSGYLAYQQQEVSPHHNANGNNFSEKMKFPISSHGEDPLSPNFLNLPNKPWDPQILNRDTLINNGRENNPYNGNSRHGFVNDMFSEPTMEENEAIPLEFLAAQFPGFAAESLAEVYVANHCDLNLTMEMLTQLELQVDGGMYSNLNSKTLSAPDLSTIDFPALPLSDGQNGMQKHAGDDLQHNVNFYRSSPKDRLMFKSSSSMPSRGAIDYASAVKKLTAQDSPSIWKYDRNGSADSSIGSSRSSHVLASSYNSGHGRPVYGEKFQNRGSARAAPTWLDTGDAVANLYSELREEARDHARLRNACFEQARQAYFIGNKALAKDLSLKGQLHNMHMKAAHGQAQESIYRQRNPASLEMQGNGRGRERMIDLHGLHVSEAIVVLKNELSMLRNAVRSTDQRLQVYICVGTGHHTRGTRTPARLPVAVQRYLLEEEGLDYTEPQPGLLRVVIY